VALKIIKRGIRSQPEALSCIHGLETFLYFSRPRYLCVRPAAILLGVLRFH
jgi:hypothetical protein